MKGEKRKLSHSRRLILVEQTPPTDCWYPLALLLLFLKLPHPPPPVLAPLVAAQAQSPLLVSARSSEMRAKSPIRETSRTYVQVPRGRSRAGWSQWKVNKMAGLGRFASFLQERKMGACTLRRRCVKRRLVFSFSWVCISRVYRLRGRSQNKSKVKVTRDKTDLRGRARPWRRWATWDEENRWGVCL